MPFDFNSLETPAAFNAFNLHSISTIDSPPFKILPISVFRLILSVFPQIKL